MHILAALATGTVIALSTCNGHADIARAAAQGSAIGQEHPHTETCTNLRAEWQRTSTGSRCIIPDLPAGSPDAAEPPTFHARLLRSQPTQRIRLAPQAGS